MRADNSAYVVAAAQRRAQETRDRALAALRRMDATGKPINFDTVAREAGVSRSWLYTQDQLRAEIERLRERRRTTNPTSKAPGRHRASDASLLRRLEAATVRIRRLEGENQELRQALALALGERRCSDILGRKVPERGRSGIIGPC
jgi:hypothetical protein